MRSMLVHTVAVHRSAAVRGLLLYRLVKRHMRCSGAGRPSFGGRRTVSSCKRFLQHRFGLSVLRRPAHRRFGSENMHRPNGGVFSSRAFAGAENEPLAVVEFTESRSNARGKHEHEYQPWFAQSLSHRLQSKSKSEQGLCCHTRGLTLPSRGRVPAGFARFHTPLTSNVRPRTTYTSTRHGRSPPCPHQPLKLRVTMVNWSLRTRYCASSAKARWPS